MTKEDQMRKYTEILMQYMINVGCAFSFLMLLLWWELNSEKAPKSNLMNSQLLKEHNLIEKWNVQYA